MEKLTYHGVFNGYPVSYTREYSGIADDIPNADDFIQATAWLETNGIKPTGASTAQPAQQQQTNSQQPPFGQERYQQSGSEQAQWQCPVHGSQKVKPGYQGRGWECGVGATGQRPNWPHRDFNGRNGLTYYCSAKSQ